MVLSLTGLTAAPTGNLNPPAGKVWKLRSMELIIETGTTVGTRTVYALLSPITQELLAEVSATTVSATLRGTGGPLPTSSFSTQAVVWTYPFYVGPNDGINFSPSIQSGDTWGFSLEIEEEDAGEEA